MNPFKQHAVLAFPDRPVVDNKVRSFDYGWTPAKLDAGVPTDNDPPCDADAYAVERFAVHPGAMVFAPPTLVIESHDGTFSIHEAVECGGCAPPVLASTAKPADANVHDPEHWRAKLVEKRGGVVFVDGKYREHNGRMLGREVPKPPGVECTGVACRKAVCEPPCIYADVHPPGGCDRCAPEDYEVKSFPHPVVKGDGIVQGGKVIGYVTETRVVQSFDELHAMAKECPAVDRGRPLGQIVFDDDPRDARIRRETIEECITAALEQRCERGTAWDRACVTIAEALRRKLA